MNKEKKTPWYNRIELAVIIVCLGMMVVVGAVNVFTRFCLSYTLSWSEQLIRLLFIWVAYAGVSYAGLIDEHLRVTAVSLVFNKKITDRVVLFGDIVTCLFAGYISYRIAKVALLIYGTGKVFASIPWLSATVMYIPGVLGCAGLVVRTIQRQVISHKNKALEVE